MSQYFQNAYWLKSLSLSANNKLTSLNINIIKLYYVLFNLFLLSSEECALCINLIYIFLAVDSSDVEFNVYLVKL